MIKTDKNMDIQIIGKIKNNMSLCGLSIIFSIFSENLGNLVILL